MSKEWTILHLSDFHIDNPNGDTELLREGFYQRYIDGFKRALNDYSDTRNKPINAIVITGDFVNGGINADNFAHAEKIIKYLCKVFNIEPMKVFTCNGNHDIDRALDEKNDFSGARHLYNEFARKFGNGNDTKHTKRYYLVSAGAGLHMLSIDSTLNAYGKSRPGDLTVTELDDIRNAIENQEIGNEDLLIVASHHPVYAFQSPFGPNPEPDQEEDWKTKHVWSSASRLFSWLYQNSPNPILWLSGDIHTQEQAQVGIIHAVVTGRFGTSIKSASTQARRHGRLITVSSSGNFKSWICQSEPKGYVDDQENEKWIVYPQNHPHSLIREHGDDSSAANHTKASQLEDTPQKKTLPYEPRIFSELIQDKIIETIKIERLYHLGRYATSDHKASLAWVPMGDLMNSDDIFPHVVLAQANHLNDFLVAEKIGNSIIVGIDSWGAILASQLSVITGIQNFCIAGRAGGSTHTSPERIGDALQSKMSKLEHVILVTDVIGTGSTLKCVHDDLCKKISSTKKQDIKWTVLSVICDEKQDRKETLGFAYSNMTACKNLRMPILLKESLPDTNILPTDISFMGQFPLAPTE